MSEKRFKLKKGITLEYPVRAGNFYNANTLTDEIAAEYLAGNPKGVSNFEEYPKDFKASKTEAKKEEPKKETPKTEAHPKTETKSEAINTHKPEDF